MDPVRDSRNSTPVLLGRPFLATADAVIKCRTGMLKLKFGNLKTEMKVADAANRIRTAEDEDECFMVDIIADCVEEHFEELIENDSDELGQLESLIRNLEAKSCEKSIETSTSEVEEARAETSHVVASLSVEVVSDSNEGREKCLGDDLLHLQDRCVDVEAKRTETEAVSDDDIPEDRPNKKDETKVLSANIRSLGEKPSELELIKSMSLEEFDKYLENFDGLSSTSSSIDTREFDEDFEDLLRELDFTSSVGSLEKIPRDVRKVDTLESSCDDEDRPCDDHLLTPFLYEPDSVSTPIFPDLRVAECSSIPGIRMWLAYDKKGELIGELVPESRDIEHGGTVKKRHTFFYLPMACDIEESLCSYDIMRPSVSSFMCSPERDYIDRYLCECILHNPVVRSIARRHEYRPHNPPSVELCVNGSSSSSVPWDIKHQ